MKEVFKKGMTVEEIKQAADERENKLMDMFIYLNEKGKAAVDTYEVIAWEATFCETIEELKYAINEHIESKCSNEKIKKNLKNFIKNYLQ